MIDGRVGSIFFAQSFISRVRHWKLKLAQHIRSLQETEKTVLYVKHQLRTHPTRHSPELNKNKYERENQEGKIFPTFYIHAKPQSRSVPVPLTVGECISFPVTAKTNGGRRKDGKVVFGECI